ncbi:hypothetical protein Tdes44962_MAKER03457 [Teratosphaeria destructans]|uniref:Uncharacterized protein n=1 Tax=Teratosphaeria destructans TaxID=418781 RepID=A0A9W7W1M1_9PEZI|nr:hypothetical protein Tdes44962_MAKER03457 [Teratosphaeria destructans]
MQIDLTRTQSQDCGDYDEEDVRLFGVEGRDEDGFGKRASLDEVHEVINCLFRFLHGSTESNTARPDQARRWQSDEVAASR